MWGMSERTRTHSFSALFFAMLLISSLMAHFITPVHAEESTVSSEESTEQSISTTESETSTESPSTSESTSEPTSTTQPTTEAEEPSSSISSGTWKKIGIGFGIFLLLWAYAHWFYIEAALSS